MRQLELRRDDVDGLDRRRLCEKLVGLRKQGLCNLPSQMRVAAGVVGEDVEDPEARAVDAKGNHETVSGSVSTSARALSSNSATCCSFPSFAVRVTSRPTVTCAIVSCLLLVE
jgi:hypothetical protein